MTPPLFPPPDVEVVGASVEVVTDPPLVVGLMVEVTSEPPIKN